MIRSLLIDTNLLTLLVVGITDKEKILTHKRTQTFSIGDFELLSNMINSVEKIWVVSHVYSETSNLLKQTNAKFSIDLQNTLASLAGRGVRESNISLAILTSSPLAPDLLNFGVCDTALLLKAKKIDAFLTDDLPLYHRASNMYGQRVINFNHVRQEQWSIDGWGVG